MGYNSFADMMGLS